MLQKGLVRGLSLPAALIDISLCASRHQNPYFISAVVHSREFERNHNRQKADRPCQMLSGSTANGDADRVPAGDG